MGNGVSFAGDGEKDVGYGNQKTQPTEPQGTAGAVEFVDDEKEPKAFGTGSQSGARPSGGPGVTFVGDK